MDEEKKKTKKFDESEYLTLKEVCSYLKISTKILYDLIHNHGFPHIQLVPRGRIFFRKKSIDRWMIRHEQPTAPEIKIEKIRLFR